MQVPGYFRLAGLILAAINQRQQELAAIIQRTLTVETRELLEALFVQSPRLEEETMPSKTAAYKLMLLKRLSQSTQPSKIKARVLDLE